ncbi:MAG: hypothetical protein OQK64_01335 [Ignavibacteriaceae bacterium]|nr:hypothetical protein [Ignavibacteriaceae bacterium]MCW8812969.1 hypothetical protein [Chlorobium sp.]MCW8995167.1 hypothetical protein [Psychromonas sp.]MCW9094543.1 hypothetical protein [Ignavibacteriaceae bacterium]
MKKIKPFFSNHFGITFLARFLYTTFWVLTVLFIILAYQRISSINFKELSLFDQSYLEQTLFDELSRPLAIGAAALAFLTLGLTASRTARMDKQLIEMKSQREASYQPDVIIAQSQFHIQTGTGEPIIDPDHHRILGKNDKMCLKVNLDEKGENEPNLFLHNIGRGVAKNFKYRFLFDANECIQLMNKFNTYNYFTIASKETYAEILTRGTPMSRFWGIYQNQDWRTKIDFILPTNGEVQPTKILLPYLYIILNFFKDELHLHSKKEFDDPSNIHILFPKLYFECEYLDIGLKQYRKRFELTLSAMVFRQLLNNEYRFNDITYDYDIVPVELK